MASCIDLSYYSRYPNIRYDARPDTRDDARVDARVEPRSDSRVDAIFYARDNSRTIFT